MRAEYLIKEYVIPIVRACKVVGLSRSMWYYQSKKDDSEVIDKLTELAESYPNRGFDEYYYKIRREGFKWNRKRVLRVYREMKLSLRRKHKKRLVKRVKQPLETTAQLNECWSMDFMSDALTDGRKVRVFNVIDDCNLEALALEALQDIRIKHRWEAIDRENEQIKQAKTNQKNFYAETFSNGDTRKQLLARSRYLLYKAPNNWTESQYLRSKILFDQYPDIKKAYDLVQGLRNIFNTATTIQTAYTKLAHWYKDVEQTGFKAFNTIAITITINYRSILNYFINRSTNASAESFNAKIKAFRAQFRGVKNVEFFLFRLTRIFA